MTCRDVTSQVEFGLQAVALVESNTVHLTDPAVQLD